MFCILVLNEQKLNIELFGQKIQMAYEILISIITQNQFYSTIRGFR